MVGSTEGAGTEGVGNSALTGEEALLDDVETDKAAPPAARTTRAATDPQAAKRPLRTSEGYAWGHDEEEQ